MLIFIIGHLQWQLNDLVLIIQMEQMDDTDKELMELMEQECIFDGEEEEEGEGGGNQEKEVVFGSDSNLNDPTIEEVERSIEAIKQKYPNLSIESIISTLYLKLVIQKPNKSIKPDLKVAPIKYVGQRKNWYYEQKLSYHRNFPLMKKKNPNIVQLNHLLMNSVDKNNLLKRVTAKCFMEFGVAYEDVVKQVKILQYPIKPQRRKYNRMVGEVVTFAFRELQRFIIKHFQPNIKPSTIKDIEILHPVLLNPFKYFTLQENRIFNEFIKINYDSDSAGTLIEKQPAYNLYKKIYKCKASIKSIGVVDEQLRRKYLKQNQQYLPNSSEAIVRIENGQVIWTKEMEHHLLYYYVHEGKISRAKKMLVKKYNNCEVLGGLLVVRRRFYKIMRESVRILQRYVWELGERAHAKLALEQEQTKMLISAPQAYNARVYLSYVYRYEQVQTELVQKALIEINQVLSLKAKYRYEQVQSKGILKM